MGPAPQSVGKHIKVNWSAHASALELFLHFGCHVHLRWILSRPNFRVLLRDAVLNARVTHIVVHEKLLIVSSAHWEVLQLARAEIATHDFVGALDVGVQSCNLTGRVFALCIESTHNFLVIKLDSHNKHTSRYNENNERTKHQILSRKLSQFAID